MIALILVILTLAVDGRFVTRASRDHVRHTIRKMERIYGQGLVGLIHPVTKEFNHAAVIEQRGGRYKDEIIGHTKDLGVHHILGALDRFAVRTGLRAPGNEDRFELLAGRFYDPYDFFSFFYGWIVAMEDGLPDDAASKCFYAAFDTVT